MKKAISLLGVGVILSQFWLQDHSVAFGQTRLAQGDTIIDEFLKPKNATPAPSPAPPPSQFTPPPPPSPSVRPTPPPSPPTVEKNPVDVKPTPSPPPPLPPAVNKTPPPSRPAPSPAAASPPSGPLPLWAQYRKTALEEFVAKKPEKAVVLMDKAMMEAKKSNVPPDTWASLLNNKGAIYRTMEKFDEAEKAYQEALQTLQNDPKTYAAQYAVALNDLGDLYRVQNKLEKAEPFYLKALEIMGQDAKDAHIIAHNLGLLYMAGNKDAKAEEYYKTAVALAAKNVGQESPPVISNLYTLALLYTKNKRYDVAEVFLSKSLDLSRKTLGAGDSNSLALEKELTELKRIKAEYDQTPIGQWQGFIRSGMQHLKNKKFPEAQTDFEKALALVEKGGGEETPAMATTLTNLSVAYIAQQKYDQAAKTLEYAIVLSEKLSGADNEQAKALKETLAAIKQKKTP